MCNQTRSVLLRGLLLPLACAALGWPVANADEAIEVATEQELNAAIEVVNAAGPGTHTITLRADIVRTGFTPTLGNPYAEEVIIDGAGHTVSGGGLDRVFDVRNTVATLRDITMTAGYANEGGGVHCGGGTLTIENARVVKSHATRGGGVSTGQCNLHLTHVVIEGNSAYDGGGVWVGGAGKALAAMDTTIRGNTAVYRGAGIFVTKDANASFSDSLIEGNSSVAGGGLFCEYSAVRLQNSRILENRVQNGLGGGIYVGSRCAADVAGTTLSHNSAIGNGGGIHNQPDGTVYITGSTLAYNEAIAGAGLNNYGGYVGILNSTFSGNKAVKEGGAILNKAVAGAPSVIQMEYTTITENTAGYGGGLLSDSAKVIAMASVFDLNSPQNCYGKYYSSSTGYNLSSDKSCLWSGVGDIDGTSADLGLLSDNGGPTLTHALNKASPALDRIPYDGKVCGGAGHDVDQRGIRRPQPWGGSCDKGAYERIPNNKPICKSAYASPLRLWPPNHKFKPVEVLGVIDPDGDALEINVHTVMQDEPVDSEGDGSFTPDAVIEGGTVKLRAERMGDSDGRVYRVSFIADDGHGESCEGSVDVGVPHDPTEEAVPGEIWYDSTLEW